MVTESKTDPAAPAGDKTVTIAFQNGSEVVLYKDEKMTIHGVSAPLISLKGQKESKFQFPKLSKYQGRMMDIAEEKKRRAQNRKKKK